MKKLVWLLVLVSALAVAQQQAAPPPVQATNLVERVSAPTYSDLYCSGFITRQTFDRSKFVTASVNAPDETMSAGTATVFLSGSGYQENQLYSIVREVRDPNRFEPFPGQRRLLGEVGQPYAELGRVRILQVRGPQAIAQIEMSCQPMSPGDLVVPFQERPAVSYRAQKIAFNRFPAAGNPLGRILMAKDFDMFVATGAKVYLTVGADKGLKTGDYLRVMRGYDPAELDPAQALSYKSPRGVDTQKYPPAVTKADINNLPRRAIGEIIVLSVTPTSATCMVTLALEDIKVGDQVVLEGPNP
jgi:hypothetical protein